MDIAKLFRVVVIGGALLTANGCSDQEDDTDDSTDPALSELPDATPEGGPDPDPQNADASVEELENCGFCPNEICCEIDDAGNSTLIDGFECCWATSC